MPMDDEARELAASERISAALAVFDESTAGYDMWDPDLEEVRFEAMRTAIAKADALRGCTASRTEDVRRYGAGRPHDDPDAGLTHWQIAEEIGALARDGRGITMTVYAAIERAFQRGFQAYQPAAPSPDRAGDGDLGELVKRACELHQQWLSGLYESCKYRSGLFAPEVRTTDVELLLELATVVDRLSRENASYRSGKLLPSTGSEEETKGDRRELRAVMRRLLAAKNAGDIEDPETQAQVLGHAVDACIGWIRHYLAHSEAPITTEAGE